VAQTELAERLDPEDADRDGVSGRQNRVPDVKTGALVPGRFGWKAEQPTVVQQCASAFLGDMGLTSALFPGDNHTAQQRACRGVPNGGSPEVSEQVLTAIGVYARALAVPARRHAETPVVSHGEDLFERIGCAKCHVPTLHTAALADFPELPVEAIHPYTDLLLHDLGDGLDDGRPVFAASGREWRTPPLWGLGLVKQVNGHTSLLHDGRARDAKEAVLWHAGEALAARRAFMALAPEDRRALVGFLESL
jgi:CxxC motif-containing protein (DUF1111 family)